MKRHWIEYCPAWTPQPMSYWVHIETDGKPWLESSAFEPPLPKPVPGRGWPVYFVECDGFTFTFASLAEIEVCLSTLSKKVLPTTLRLSAERGTGMGPNSHWLSRLPKGMKPWRYREKAVRCLTAAKADFEKETAECPKRRSPRHKPIAN